MLILQGVAYTHPDKDLLFNDISLSVNRYDKVALVGNNGTGKSTLLRIMAGLLQPSQGQIITEEPPYYVPQHFGQYNQLTIAQALQVDAKLNALKEILAGNVTEANMTVLADDWSIEERCDEALAHWQLQGIALNATMDTLSGGQKTKVFLAGMTVHNPQVVLMDEPTNHLDSASRQLLYEYIRQSNSAMVVVSHDRALLIMLNTVYELNKRGIQAYGGNYDFYKEQKAVQANAFDEELKSKEKALRKAKETERETLERQQKLDARGRKKQDKAGMPAAVIDKLKNSAEKSSGKLKDVHAAKTDTISKEVVQLRKRLPDKDKMKIGFDNTELHKGKVLVSAKDINYGYADKMLWKEPLNMEIVSGGRIAIKGGNGNGKTTLVRMITGELQPQTGSIVRAGFNAIYIDQDYSLIDNNATVYEQVQRYNSDNMEEHELKSRLTHFLFTRAFWDKPCAVLSGGEKMRLMLCCLTIGNHAPDMIILDEPTNNLDIQNTEILTAAIQQYEGTMIAISHDEYFLQEVGVDEVITL